MEKVATRGQILWLKRTKFDFGWGSAPEPAGGAHSAPPDTLFVFYAPQLVPAGTAEARLSYGNSVCLSVCPSICPSRLGTDSRPSEIETPGLHRMIAQSL